MFRIGSVIDTSLIDYPRTIATVFFMQGCNLQCPYCHNKKLIPIDESVGDPWSGQDIIEYLRKKRGRIDGVVFSGGEPSVHNINDWKSLVSLIKKHLDVRIKIDTNGLDSVFIKKTMPYVDMYAIDIKAVPDKYKTHLGCHWSTIEIEAGLKLIKGLLEEFKGDVEYRTTMYKPLFENFKDLIFMNEFIPKNAIWYLQNYVGEEESFTKKELQGIAEKLREQVNREILIRSY